MSFQLQRKIFSVEEYHKMAEIGIFTPEDRVELIHGEIIRMSPIKSVHASVVDFLNEELITWLRKKAIIRIQNPVTLSDISEPEPDLVVTHYQNHRYKKAHPTPKDIILVIEVADSSLNYDREVKLPLYAEAEIPEYWIINLVDKQVEVYQKPVKQQYTQHQILFPGQQLELEAFGWSMAISKLF